MNKLIFTALAILAGGQLQAQTGNGAAVGKSAASDNQWQNWVFSASALVTATTAVIILTTNPGQAH